MSNLSLRLQQARKMASLSLRGLADLVGLSHAAIKKYEDGDVYPSSDVLLKIAKALNIRIDFFFRPIKYPSLKDVKFRKRKKLSKKAEEIIKFDIINQIERRFELENLYPFPALASFKLPENIPLKITHLEEIESLAESLRDFWRLGRNPIHNLIDALENHGVRVFIVDSSENYFDGFSTVIDDQPIIVISSRWPGDRQRFNLIHELCHYILKNRLPSSINEEQACNRFSGAFLIPKEVIFQVIGEKRHAIELPELILLKEQFQMSLAAICFRLRDLKVINESTFKQLMIRFRKQGWHLDEPGVKILPEKAHTFERMLFHALSEEYIGESKAAELLCCSLNQLKALRQVKNPRVVTH